MFGWHHELVYWYKISILNWQWVFSILRRCLSSTRLLHGFTIWVIRWVSCKKQALLNLRELLSLPQFFSVTLCFVCLRSVSCVLCWLLIWIAHSLFSKFYILYYSEYRYFVLDALYKEAVHVARWIVWRQKVWKTNCQKWQGNNSVLYIVIIYIVYIFMIYFKDICVIKWKTKHTTLSEQL